jgi:hypothetical protein
VVEMRVDDEALVDRISAASPARTAARSTTTRPKPPSRRASATSCGGTEFVRRADDNAESVRVRLAAYYRNTAPLIGYYHAKGKLRVVDGLGEMDRWQATSARRSGCDGKVRRRGVSLSGVDAVRRFPILRALSESGVVSDAALRAAAGMPGITAGSIGPPPRRGRVH